MKMRYFCLFLLIMGSYACFAGGQSNQDEKVKNNKNKEEYYKKTGGAIVIPQKGFIGLVDFQNEVPLKNISDKVAQMFKGFNLATKAFKETRQFTFSDMLTYKDKINAGAVIFIVNEPDLPMSLSAIEARCGLVNVAYLKKDNPSSAVLTRRTWKVARRVATLVCGGAESSNGHNMMSSITSLKELDANEATGDEVYVMMGIINGTTKAGVLPQRRMTYRQACQKGLAPAPTNAVQQVIWDEIKGKVLVK